MCSAQQSSTPQEATSQNDEAGDASSKPTRGGVVSCVTKNLGINLIARFFGGEDRGPAFATCGAATIAGVKPKEPGWTNQDNFAVAEGTHLGERMQVFLLFDGHGTHGHLVSQHCRDNMPRILSETNYNPKEAFEKMHDDLVKSDVDVDSSGTTCVAVIIHGGKRYTVASVGDSRAVLAARVTRGEYRPLRLTTNHKPKSPGEVERIEEAGGFVGPRHPDLPDSFPENGATRVWYRTSTGTLTGMCMSRSLGDFSSHKVGVTHEPYTDCDAIEVGNDFIVMGSDGVFDYMKDEEVIEIVQKCKRGKGTNDTEWDPQEAASLVAQAARDEWEERKKTKIDDITCLVVKLG